MVTFSVLHYANGDRYRGFTNMGRWMMRPFAADGLKFQKMMGCGHNFGLIPDFSTYTFLAVWASESQARRFFESESWRQLFPTATEIGTLYLQPLRSHGRWDGENPFGDLHPAATSPGRPVVVLTRATVRFGALVDFWRHVPQARQRLEAYREELLFAVGAGEKPWIQQCTVSVWKNEKAIEQYAYRGSGHKEVVRRTRDRRWYAEELFARFTVVDSTGTFNGRSIPLEQPAPVSL